MRFLVCCVLCMYAGGPGSGKVTHCDTLMEERRGVTHINMMDLLHQHVISNGTYKFILMEWTMNKSERCENVLFVIFRNARFFANVIENGDRSSNA